LSECQKGSDEWYESLKDVNTITQTLLDDFPELMRYGFEYNEELGRYVVAE